MVLVRDGEVDASNWIDRTPCDGRVEWGTRFRPFSEAGFTGPTCLDVRGDAPAKQGLAQATALIQLIRAVTD